MGNRYRKRYLPFSSTRTFVNASTGVMSTYPDSDEVVVESGRVGYDDPFWRSKVIRGVSATTLLNAYKQEAAWTRGYMTLQWNWPTARGHGKSFSGNNTPKPTVIPPTVDTALHQQLLADAKNKAAIGILKKIQTQTQTWAGLTFLGELRETIRMIRHPAATLRQKSVQFFHQAKKTRKMKRKDRKSVLADQWLEYSFGVSPAMSDIAAIADASIKRLHEERIIRLSYTAQSSHATSSVTSATMAGFSAVFPREIERVDEVSYRYLVGFRERIPEEYYFSIVRPFQRVVQLGGFNLSELLPTAWELLPWSFFVDYFTNIGDVLSTVLVCTKDVAWSQGTARHSMTINDTCKLTLAKPGDHLVLKDASDAYSASSTTVVARGAGGIAIPQFRFETSLGVNQFLNLAALARNALRGGAVRH